MWSPAYARIRPSVAALVLKHERKKPRIEWRVAGTAIFLGRSPLPTFLTCAHVLLDGHHQQRGEFTCLTWEAGSKTVPLGVRVEHVFPEIDAAVFVTGHEVFGSPASFSERDLRLGASVAALGVPLPNEPELHADGGGTVNVQLRLTTGFVSSSDALARLPETRYTSPDLEHYELNMFAYPGISGGPLFDISGFVVGMMRGTRLARSEVVAPYSYADRNRELLSVLRQKGVPFELASDT
jgi:hypothetical protein